MASHLLSLGFLLLIAASGAAAFRTGNTAAIHIGNTKSCIAGYGGPHDPDTSYTLCIPSWVAFTDNGTLFGQAALKHAAVSPGTAVSGFKRVIGLRIEDEVVKREMELVPYNLVVGQLGKCGIQIRGEGGDAKAKDLLPQEVAGILMSKLKQMAEAHLGREITTALVTAPRHFTGEQRQSLRARAQFEGGFSATRSVREYVAVAAAYGLHEKTRDGKTILVFHMGGRTTHATRFRFKDGMARLLGSRYDAHLGGADLTGRVVDHFVQLIKEKHHRDIRRDESALRKLRAACENAKKALSQSYREETMVMVESLLDGANFFEPLTRAKFEELNDDLLARAMGMVEQTVTWPAPPDQWESRKDSIDEIILVGGSVRIRKIGQFFRDYFHGREPIMEEEAVIRGAAHLSRPESAIFTNQCDDYHNGSFLEC